jgi:hypothetical protein
MIAILLEEPFFFPQKRIYSQCQIEHLQKYRTKRLRIFLLKGAEGKKIENSCRAETPKKMSVSVGKGLFRPSVSRGQREEESGLYLQSRLEREK